MTQGWNPDDNTIDQLAINLKVENRTIKDDVEDLQRRVLWLAEQIDEQLKGDRLTLDIIKQIGVSFDSLFKIVEGLQHNQNKLLELVKRIGNIEDTIQ